MTRFFNKRDAVDYAANKDGFLKALVIELDKSFFRGWKNHVEELAGTRGFNCAFTKICKEFDLDIVLDYYDRLTWNESDDFDELVLQRIKYIEV